MSSAPYNHISHMGTHGDQDTSCTARLESKT